MDLVSQGNVKYYSMEHVGFNNKIMSEFGRETISDALADGVTAGGLLAGIMSNIGRRTFKLGSQAMKFTTAALKNVGLYSVIVSGCSAIIIKYDKYEADQYNAKLQSMGEIAVNDLDRLGYGYITVKTEDFAYVSENGNNWSGTEPLVTNIYWSSKGTGKRI